MAENDRILPPLEMTRMYAIKAQSNTVRLRVWFAFLACAEEMKKSREKAKE
jgi:hypothetical protein